jgi:hypothetical protein
MSYKICWQAGGIFFPVAATWLSTTCNLLSWMSREMWKATKFSFHVNLVLRVERRLALHKCNTALPTDRQI